MDTGFFQSKQFVASAIVATLILAGGALAVSQSSLGPTTFRTAGCDARVLPGAAIDVAPVVADEEERRVLTFTLDAAAFDAATVKLCTRAGDIVVEPTSADALTLEVRIVGGTAAERAEMPLHTSFTTEGSALGVAAWEGAREYPWRFSGSIPSAQIVLRVPDAMLTDADLANVHGDVRASGLRASTLNARTSSGDVALLDILAEGGVEAASRFGDVTLQFASVQTGNVTAETSSGDVEVRLPSRADVGYDVYAETRTGEVTVRVGDAETYESDARGLGQEVHVRTRGFDAAPTQVTVRTEARHGDVLVVAEEVGT